MGIAVVTGANSGIGLATTIRLARDGHEVYGAMRDIVNVSSLAGRFSQVTMGAYTASKFAVEGLSEVLAQEVAPYGIRVVVVEPGTINTPIFTKAPAPPEGTAYPMHYHRAVSYFAHTLTNAPGPEAVADVIAAAVAAEAPALRHPVGADAHAILQGRQTMTDEELVALGALDTDEWFAAIERHFGLRLR